MLTQEVRKVRPQQPPLASPPLTKFLGPRLDHELAHIRSSTEPLYTPTPGHLLCDEFHSMRTTSNPNENNLNHSLKHCMAQ